MGIATKIFVVLFSIAIAILYYRYNEITKPLVRPNLNTFAYWGLGDKFTYNEDTSIIPHRISYPSEVIEDLRKLLIRNQKYLPPLEGIAFEYGFNSIAIKNITTYWRDNYLPRWKERELYLWKFPHFTTQIQGLRIHFIHTKIENPKGKKVYPLLLLNGWPSSVREFYDIIPKYTDYDKNKEYLFEVVVPSLPGYAWSQGSSKPGFGPAEIGVVLRNLMLRLGYKKFFIQGADWGSVIGSHIATIFPENVLGYHSNMCFLSTPMSLIKTFLSYSFRDIFLTKEENDFLSSGTEKMLGLIEESGYFHIQATKPDTLGIALTENPIGLAAYILEKFSTWTNSNNKKLVNGGLTDYYSLDALLDNVMIYYLTNSITTSMRIYAESFTFNQRNHNLERVPTSVPTGCARFKYDLGHTIDWALKDKYFNLIHSTYNSNGGHFISLEQPETIYKDFVQFIREFHKFELKD